MPKMANQFGFGESIFFPKKSKEKKKQLVVIF
jgi:hypothetical protein